MICPYVQNSHVLIQKNARNEEFAELIDACNIIEYWGNMTCKKEECGAWYEGRCRYNE